MVTKNGHLFHIDFGHFLGHFKTKLGFKRGNFIVKIPKILYSSIIERTPFVFTEEMAHVMGGKGSPDFIKFSNFCTQAYNLVRNKGNLIISLFIIMLAAGMPELESYSDIEYLKNQLSLDLSEMEANNKFINEIHNSLDDTFRRIDNLFHALKRKTEKSTKKDKDKAKKEKEKASEEANAATNEIK